MNLYKDISEEDEYDDEEYRKPTSVPKTIVSSRKEKIKNGLKKLKKIITEPDELFEDELYDAIDENNQLEDLKSMKRSMLSNDRELVPSISSSGAIEQLEELNPDAAFINKNTKKKNCIYTFDDVDLKLPEGFYYDETGSITNKGNTEDGKSIEFNVVRFENDKSELFDFEELNKKNIGK